MNTEAIRELFELFSRLTDANYRVLIQEYPWIPEDRSELQQTLQQNPQLALSTQEDLRFMEVVDENSLVQMLRRRTAQQAANQNQENLHVESVLFPQPLFRMHRNKLFVKRLKTPEKSHKRCSQSDSSVEKKKRRKE